MSPSHVYARPDAKGRATDGPSRSLHGLNRVSAETARHVAFLALLLLSSAYALARGDHPERIGAVTLLCGALLARQEILTAILSGLALALVSVTSHAADASPAHFAAIGIFSDAAHLLCGGLWLGGLCILGPVMSERRAAPRLTAALSLFAGWGMIAVALLVMTGLINAASIVLGQPGHASNQYLGVLGAKLVLVLAMTVLALSNHFRLMPRLTSPLDRPGAAASLKGNIAWEMGLGLIVVLLAALLGLLSPTL